MLWDLLDENIKPGSLDHFNIFSSIYMIFIQADCLFFHLFLELIFYLNFLIGNSIIHKVYCYKINILIKTFV